MAERARFLVLLIVAALALGTDECEAEGEIDAPADPGDLAPPGDSDAAPSPDDTGLDGLAADCAPLSWVSCGDVVSGDTSNFNAGASDAIDYWPIGIGNYRGPEMAWTFRAPASGEVTWRLLDADPMSIDHDLFVLAGDDSCLADRVMHRGFNSVTFDALPGEAIHLVIDGYDGAEGPFTWQLDCDDDGAAPVEPGDDGDEDRACCVWLDLDKTLNTFGAWGYPFNPVPAAEFCSVLDSLGSGVVSTPLTARSGCLPSLQPGESQCSVLQSTVSVDCSSGAEAAGHKLDHMRSRDAFCGRHVLIDDNTAGSGITGGDPPVIYVEPRAFDWDGTLGEILAALEGC